MFCFRAMRSYLSLCDDSVTVSLTADIDSLEADTRQLEQILKQSLLSLPSMRRHSEYSSVASDRTTHIAEPGLVETSTLLKQVLDCNCHDDIDHRTLQTDTSLCRCHQLVPTHQRYYTDVCSHHADACSHGLCCESALSENTDSVLTDARCLSQYKSCCSKLDQLITVCLSLSHSASQHHSQ